MNEVEYDCWSSDAENFYLDLGFAIEEAIDNCDTYEEALDFTITAGVALHPNIKSEYFVENLIERVKEELWELCGEYSDSYFPEKEDVNELQEYLQKWLDKQQYNCYNVRNTKQFPLTHFLTEDEIAKYYE